MSELLRMEHISKRFGSFYANKDISLTVNCGEVLTLLGENGAGKSTLMNILIGLYQPTEGKIFLEGKEVRIESPSQAVKLGIGMVHQHFMLVEAMTVFDNIILGDKHAKGVFIDRAARRIVTGKERGVNAVHGSEVVHVAQENGGFDDVFHGCAGSLEDGPAVFKRLAGLLLDRGGESTGGHINGKLAGRDDQAARPDALRIRADRRRGLFGCDNVFQFWFSPPWCENSLSSPQNAVNINHKSFQGLNIFLFIAHKFQQKKLI